VLGADGSVDTPTAARLTQVDRQPVYDALASGVLALGGDRFLLVDDDLGICLVRSGENAELLLGTDAHPVLADLEGICWTPERDAVLLVSEAKRTIIKLGIEERGGDVRLGDPEIVGKLPKVRSGNRNKGWEGIETAPGRFFDDGQPRLIGVKEGKPRRVGVFRFPDFEQECLLKLPDDAKAHLADISDVAVDPETGHLFLLSDESHSVVELELKLQKRNAPGAVLDRSTLTTLGVTELDTQRKEKAEGIDFGPDGALWIATDGRSSLLKFEVERN